MSRSGQKKEKYGSSDLSLDNCNDGTAARTRPLSFHEIIIRRKNKKSPEEIKEAARGSENKSGDCTIENVSDHRESERHHKHNIDSSDGVDKHFSEGVVKLGSQGKEDTIPPNGSNSARRDRERRESEKKIRDDSLPKHKHREVLRSEIRLKDGSLAKENNTGESCRSEIKLKAEMKEKFTKDKGKVDKQILGLGKNYEWPSENSKDVAVKKHSRDLTGKDRHEGRSGEKSERESKRKHRSGNDEKNGDGNAVKKHDLLKRRDSEISERRERKESQKSHYGESRLKRMRSRSREREERNRRLSISVSPKAHRHTSYHGREHEELFAHSSKGRSGRHHSDIDRSRGTSNGSNNHYSRWHGGSTSGLGGYSPRKRRTDAAVKTPSPVSRSPEKKSAKWDVAPSDSNTVSDPVPSTFQMSNQNASVNADELVRATSLSSSEVKPLDVASVSASLTRQNISIYSHQLTQATKPLRSLYVDNVPASVSEKAVIEFLNNFLLSSGADQIRGSQPCISCVIQKDKGQAVIEFLTPEDATAALSCDGISFFGSILKIRRPKDFVEVANGEEKSVAAAAADAISDTVKDSPHKIFIGGISKTFSSKMIMEIASAFGPLKAFHFEVNEDHDEPCAFLEYVDRSVTQKACVGLNGMKLGGQVLTVVQAILDGSSLENNGSSSFYGIPEHAVPLLEKPTQVLKLKNVFNQEGLSSLSDLEVEEVLEDVRLECARFGTVKSVNVVKYGDSNVDNLDMCEVSGYVASAGIEENLRCNERNVKAESLKEAMDNQSEEIKGLEFPHDAKEVKEVEEGNRVSDNNPVGGVVLDEPCPLDRHDSNMAAEGLMRQSLSKTLSPEAEQPNTLKDGTCCHEDKVACRIEMDGISLDNKLSAEEELNLDEVNRNLQEASAGFDGSVETHSDSIENGGKEKQDNNLARIFEQGCVFVEYRRTEASCTAAHCLHGRLFDDRIVTVEYVPLDLYKKRFTK